MFDEEDDLYVLYKLYHGLGRILALEWLNYSRESSRYVLTKNKYRAYFILALYVTLFHLFVYDSLPKRDPKQKEMTLDIVVQYVEIIIQEIIFLFYYVTSYKNTTVLLKFHELLRTYNELIVKYELGGKNKIYWAYFWIGLISIPFTHVFLSLSITYLCIENLIHKTIVLKLFIGYLLTYKTLSCVFILMLLKGKYAHLIGCFDGVDENNCERCRETRYEHFGNVAAMCLKHRLRAIMDLYVVLNETTRTWIEYYKMSMLTSIVICYMEGARQVMYFCNVLIYHEKIDYYYFHIFVNGVVLFTLIIGGFFASCASDSIQRTANDFPRKIHHVYMKLLRKDEVNLDVVCISLQIMKEFLSFSIYGAIDLTPYTYLSLVNSSIKFGIIAVGLKVYV